MTRMHKAVFLFVLGAFLAGASPLKAQPLAEGMWTGFMVSPGKQPFETRYRVAHEGDSTRITMMVNDWSREFPFTRVRQSHDVLSFTWDPSFPVDCRLQRMGSGVFQGACRDEQGNMGPVVMVPPGMQVGPDVLDLEVAFAPWRMLERRAELSRAEDPIGTFVEVDGRRVHLLDLGKGDVTVVLEAGLGDPLRVWDYVQHEAARFARVVSYDRAGLGFSEDDGKTPTPAHVAEALHQVLSAAEIPPPYVLVGHAAGGFFVRAFAARYPEAVAGLVLVDPDHEAQGRRWRAMDEASWDAYWSGQQALHAMAPPGLQAEFNAYRQVIETGTLPGAGALPDVPTFVLTAMRASEAPRWVGDSAAGRAARAALHRAWVKGLADGRHEAVGGGGSYLQREAPEVVLRALRQVVDAARARKAH